MASAPKVVEEDREQTRQKRPLSPWMWLMVGVVLGVGSSILVLRGGDRQALTTATTSTGSTVVTQLGIGDVVEGLSDSLVAVARREGQLELLHWPSEGEMFTQAIPVGAADPPRPAVFDAVASRIATLLSAPEEADGVLHAGVPGEAAIVATGVTGYAWHDTIASDLAYTTFGDGEMLLWSLPDPIADARLVTRIVGVSGGVRDWGDWGYALQDEGRGSFLLLTSTGEIRTTQPGRILDSDGAGWLAVDDGGVRLVSSGGGVAAGPELEGAARAARFAPEGDALAVLSADGATVVSLDGGTTLVESGERAGVPEIAWTSDGRFAAYPAVTGIVLLDTTDGGSDHILIEQVFTGLAFLPVDSS